MLASFLVMLRPRQAAPIGRNTGRSLHALLLNMIRQVDPALAEALHAEARVKPFTVSMLQGRFSERGRRRWVRPEEVYRVRYTVLSDAVSTALGYILMEKQTYREPVMIDGERYEIVDIVTDAAASDGWAGLSSFETLMEECDALAKIRLEFASPTTFRQGDVNLLFPLPESVFGSYVRRWNAVAPLEFDQAKTLDAVATWVVAERYDLATRVVPYGAAQYNGFVGYCEYRIFSEDTETLRLLNLLADFALFTGTGQKTTQGMGQTRRVAL